MDGVNLSLVVLFIGAIVGIFHAKAGFGLLAIGFGLELFKIGAG